MPAYTSLTRFIVLPILVFLMNPLIITASHALDIQSIPLTAAEQQEIQQGDIILKKRDNPPGKSAGQAFAAIGLIPAQITAVYPVLINYTEYPKFMPNMETLTLLEQLEQPPNSALADITLTLPLGKYKKYRLSMTSAITAQQATLVWELRPRPGLQPLETIVDTQGYWLLTPAPEQPQHTLVTYYAYTDPGPIPFGLGWIVDWLTQKSLPDVIRKTRERVLALQASAKPK